jgi:hypothetical protein
MKTLTTPALFCSGYYKIKSNSVKTITLITKTFMKTEKNCHFTGIYRIYPRISRIGNLNLKN